MSISLKIDGDKMTLAASGWLDISSQYAFFDYMEEGLSHPGLEKIEVDLSEVTHMDSSGQGMLVVLKSRAEKLGIRKVILKGAQGVVRQSIKIAHLERLFTVE